MRITNWWSSVVRAERRSSSSGKVKRKSGEFSRFLREETEERLWEEGRRILEELDEAAENLEEDMTEAGVEKFVGAVKKFLKFTLERGYKLVRRPGGFLRGKQRVYVIIEKVDEKLEELFEEFKKRDKVRLIEKVKEIKGLLVDLYR